MEHPNSQRPRYLSALCAVVGGRAIVGSTRGRFVGWEVDERDFQGVSLSGLFQNGGDSLENRGP